jgi:hypothetical protein
LSKQNPHKSLQQKLFALFFWLTAFMGIYRAIPNHEILNHFPLVRTLVEAYLPKKTY